MDPFCTNRLKRYDRVMPRVYERLQTNFKSCVTRHDKPSTSSFAAKASVSNVSSCVISELPIVLNDYVPETPKQRKPAKPRKTISSLDPATSPQRIAISQHPRPKISNLGLPNSAPTIINSDIKLKSDSQLNNCYSSISHSRLKDLKDEIKSYREIDKQLKLRSKLYKNCGVVLNDTTTPAADKFVQLPGPVTVNEDSPIR